jgi:hypothetical protein
MSELSRRRLFKLGGATTLAAAGLPLEASLVPSFAGATARFDLSTAGHPLYVSNGASYAVTTGVDTVPQNFGFDEMADALFVNQRTLSNAQGDPSALGNLVISRFAEASPKSVVSQMKVIRAGHGAGLGVEHISGSLNPYLWIEMGVNADGAGTGVARLQYRATTTSPTDTRPYLGADHPDYPNVAPVYSGWDRPRAYIDRRYDQLAIWYRSTGPDFTFRVVVWRMADVRTPNPAVINNLSTLSPIRDRVIAGTGNGTSYPVQGLCVYGDYAYFLQGSDKYTTPYGETHIRCYDLTQPSGGIVQDTTITIWSSMARREPEGLTVKVASSGAANDKLVYGLVDGPKSYWLAYKSGFA